MNEELLYDYGLANIVVIKIHVGKQETGLAEGHDLFFYDCIIPQSLLGQGGTKF